MYFQIVCYKSKYNILIILHINVYSKCCIGIIALDKESVAHDEQAHDCECLLLFVLPA